MEFETIILIVTLAFVGEFIDSSMGMLYGTILSPLLIILGYEPLVVVPSILLSQACGGFVASIFHHKFTNASFRAKTINPKIIIKKLKEVGITKSFKIGFSEDIKIVFIISSLGIVSTILAVIFALSIPKWALKSYIGVLVILMGFILLSKRQFKFTWKKMLGIGILSSFNKGLSGGGFGPVVTTGQIIAGNNSKSSIASTTLSEVPICLTAFLTYFLINGFSDWIFLSALTLGSVIAAPLGALLTSKINEKRLRPILGTITLILGIWTIYKIIF